MLKSLCCTSEQHLHEFLVEFLKKNGYKKIKSKNEYIYAEGADPVCLIAHLDTVFPGLPPLAEFYLDKEKNVLWNPAGSGFDDRAGVYAIIQVILSGHHPTVVFTHGEEVGGIGASALIKDMPKCPNKNIKAIIQLDRNGYNDMVFYDCDNQDFVSYIGSFGFEENFGTFTDISIIAPQWGIAAVNLSIGYEHEHSKGELLHLNWCDRVIDKTCEIIRKSHNMKKYKYIKFKLGKNNSDNYFKTDISYHEQCIACNKPLKPAERNTVPGMSPYVICDECYGLYFNY